MPSLASWIFQSTTVSSLAGLAGFYVYTKHVKVHDLNPAFEPLVRSQWIKKFNPESNPYLADEVVRKIPLWKVKRSLVEDAEKGGSKLVEAFSGGVWGCFGYEIQRKYLERKYRNNTTTAHQLWDKSALLSDKYEPGTEVTDHFVVLSKTKDSIIFRGGDSPLKSPDGPRESDGLIELSATTDLEKGFAEFRFKCLFYQGLGKSDVKPMSENGGIVDWLHKQYSKLLVESGLGNVLA